jgi:acetyl esterase/lipase
MYLPLFFINNIIISRYFDVQKIRFGNDPNQSVYILKPSNYNGTKRINVFIHGGGWRNGYAAIYQFIGLFFKDMNEPIVLLGYGLVPKHKHPEQIGDCRKGLNLALGHLGIKETEAEISYFGHSAGGQLAAILALTEEKSRILRLVTLSSPLDFDECKFEGIHKLILEYLGFSTDTGGNPIKLLKKGIDFEFIILHGEKDKIVNKEASYNFFRKAKELDIKASLIIANKHHLDMLMYLYHRHKLSKQMRNILKTAST